MNPCFIQAGAIAWRPVGDRIDVLLITTSSGKNLTIPKGLIDPGFTAEQTVHNEAFEEAGIRGSLQPTPVGMYRFAKWGGICDVTVYLMTVNAMLDDYPEKAMRQRMWVDHRQAAIQVKHAGLGALILKVPENVDMQDEKCSDKG
ncbi:hypothetical protein DSCO28_66630 [Desulfosarcina ovata subsp. sediminis]|uniref:Nudix hydrolase domain-containing protein n=1 Tax=Desulfosarcina ovata subsp. sediminis TaxID=885957 RepID=A0A5K8A0V4_9BACT|nr:NUDIX hydrolase [Desulfosarcina ovata]BBO86097.1 hypothetical protein DSCO28_66630 [Desulfosarcina ovata subsp. sediminis]